MSDCTRYADDLKALVDGELPFARRWIVERHVAACPTCRDEAAAMRQIGEGLRLQKPEPLDAALRARILAAIPEGAPTSARRPMPRRLSWAVVGSVAGIAALVFLFGPATRQFVEQAPENLNRASGGGGSSAAAPASAGPAAAGPSSSGAGQDSDEIAPQAKAMNTDRAAAKPAATRTESFAKATHPNPERRKAEARGSILDTVSPQTPAAAAGKPAMKELPERHPIVRADRETTEARGEDYKRNSLAENGIARNRSLSSGREAPSGGSAPAAAANMPALLSQNSPAVNPPAQAAGKPVTGDRNAISQAGNSVYLYGAAGSAGRSGGLADSGRGMPRGGSAGGGFGGGGGAGGFGRGLGTNPAEHPSEPGMTLRRGGSAPEGPAGTAGYRDSRGLESLDTALGMRTEPLNTGAVVLGLSVTDVPTKRSEIGRIVNDVKGTLAEAKPAEKKDALSESETIVRLHVDPAKLSAVVERLEKLGDVTEKIVTGTGLDSAKTRFHLELQEGMGADRERGGSDKAKQQRDSDAVLRQEASRQYGNGRSQVRSPLGDQVAAKRLTAAVATITVKLKEKKPAVSASSQLSKPATRPAARPPDKK